MQNSDLFKALGAFQRDCPTVIENKTAKIKSDKGTYEYSYADLGAILTAIRPALAANGLSFSQAINAADGVTTLTTSVFHDGGGSLQSVMMLPIGNMQPQAIGSLLTYYRRYSLSALLGIAAEDDDDGEMAQNSATTHLPQPATSATMPQAKIDEFLAEFAKATNILELTNSFQTGASMATKEFNDVKAFETLKAAAGARMRELWASQKESELDSRLGKVPA